jgi:hypothetical protein
VAGRQAARALTGNPLPSSSDAEQSAAGTPPAGDYAALLVQRATSGDLAPASQRRWDVETPSGEHLQVKARVVTNPKTAGERQLSVFRSWDFDACVIVDDQFRVKRAARTRRIADR